MSYSDRFLWSSKDETFDGASTLAPAITFCPMSKALVHKIGLRVTNTATGGITSAVFTKNSGASTTSAVGTIVVPASNQQGKLIYKELATPIEFNPGDFLTIVVTESGTAPTAIPVMEVSMSEVKLVDATNTVVTG